MGTQETVTAQIDEVIDGFNRRRLDLPDGFFDRKAQFIINGAAFESLLSTTPNDPLVMMLARGPAGYRFTAKALQHAVPDAKIERGELETESQKISVKLWLSGTLRGTNEQLNALAAVTLQLNSSGSVEIAEATLDPVDLQKIREARLRN